MNMDWEKDVSRKVEWIPDGAYEVELDRWEHTEAKTGTKQVRWWGRVSEGEHEGAPLVEHIPLLDTTKWRVGNFVQAALGTVEGLPKMAIPSPIFDRLMDQCKGRKMLWVLGTRPDKNGVKRNQVNDVVAVGEPANMEEIDLEDDVPDFAKGKKNVGEVPF